MTGRRDRARADDDFRLTLEDRCHQLGDVLGVVLIVRVRIDDHVRPGLQRRFEPGHERAGEAAMPREAHDVVDAVLTRHVGGPIPASVVDHQPLHDIDPRNSPRQRR